MPHTIERFSLGAKRKTIRHIPPVIPDRCIEGLFYTTADKEHDMSDLMKNIRKLLITIFAEEAINMIYSSGNIGIE